MNSTDKLKLTTYQPDNSLQMGFIALFAEILYELGTNRWLILQLFRREFSAKYRQSFTGIIWAFVMPITSIGTFIVLNNSGIFNIGYITVPYPIYVVFSMALWQLFSMGLIASSNSLVDAGSMITKINFSKKSLVIASVGQSIVSFSIYLSMSALLFIWYGFVPNIASLLVPLAIIPLVLFTFGLGFIFALLNGITRDVGNMLSFLTTFLMFLTPVLYSKPPSGILASLTMFNPLYYLISVPKDLVFIGNTLEWKGFLFSSVFSIVVFIVCLLVFHLTETRVAERI